MTERDSRPGDSPKADHAASPAKKPRSPVERAIVWGGILILAGVLAFEARQKSSYGSSIDRVKKAFAEQELVDKHYTLTDVRQLIAGGPSETQSPHANKAWRRLEMKWPSLFKDYRMEFIMENDGENPLVITFSTPQGEDPEPTVPPGNETAGGPAAHAPPMPMGGPGMMGMGGGRGPGGGGPGGGAGGRPPRGRGMIAMALRDEVAEELKLSDNQRGKLTEIQEGQRGEMEKLRELPDDLRAEAMKQARAKTELAARDALDEAQFVRLRQLLWRELGLAALERDDAAEALGMNDEEKAKLRAVFVERQASQGGLRDASPDQMAEWRKQWEDRIRGVVTEAQLKQWEELLGSPAPAAADASAAPNRPARPARENADAPASREAATGETPPTAEPKGQ